ncbi:hypothetical protein LCGC14_1883760 [marine sediment metagenome]|uniref:Uncharacterized protein n=1 Tax=marine sediment metagenome TaxID=412755 RepID=A0A0F9IFF9_9ZZZZ
MNTKKVVKTLIKFARREYSEKRPLSVRVLRLKEAQVFSRGGPIKTLRVNQMKNPYYLVVVEYKKQMRIYSYSLNGVSSGAENLDITKNLLDEIKKKTVKEYEIPK